MVLCLLPSYGTNTVPIVRIRLLSGDFRVFEQKKSFFLAGVGFFLYLCSVIWDRMICFYADRVEMPVYDRVKVEAWIRATAAQYGFSVGNMNYIFCSDARILEVNKQFLQHDYFTDIITFDYSTPTVVAGDIYISLDTVRSNAEEYGESELMRVIIHGLLHLTGQNDKTPEDEKEMHRKEDVALRQLIVDN